MSNLSRHKREEEFHDEWASSAMMDLPDPIHVNEALTSPELRHIHKTLGDVKGKKVMDLGCGLGEASVYFAIRGAEVVAVDISPRMLLATRELANRHKVQVFTHKAASESIGLLESDSFDIIYVGNLFHHVDIPVTLDRLLKHLRPDGILVSWDPLAYNPLINVYRRIATKVRTIDEHPLKRSDVREVSSRFKSANVEFFWFCTLAIFVIMAMTKNPNKVRFWKSVVDESEKWSWLYTPLAAIDRVLLKIFPPLKWLCWNVVIICKDPKSV